MATWLLRLLSLLYLLCIYNINYYLRCFIRYMYFERRAVWIIEEAHSKVSTPNGGGDVFLLCISFIWIYILDIFIFHMAFHAIVTDDFRGNSSLFCIKTIPIMLCIVCYSHLQDMVKKD